MHVIHIKGQYNLKYIWKIQNIARIYKQNKTKSSYNVQVDQDKIGTNTKQVK